MFFSHFLLDSAEAITAAFNQRHKHCVILPSRLPKYMSLGSFEKPEQADYYQDKWLSDVPCEAGRGKPGPFCNTWPRNQSPSPLLSVL